MNAVLYIRGTSEDIIPLSIQSCIAETLLNADDGTVSAALYKALGVYPNISEISAYNIYSLCIHRSSLSLSLSIYIYIYVCVCVCVIYMTPTQTGTCYRYIYAVYTGMYGNLGIVATCTL